MNNSFLIFLLVLMVTFGGCNDNTSTESIGTSKEEIQVKIEKKPFVEKVEKAHNREAFLSKESIQFDIVLKFGGTERLNGKMTLLTNSNKGLIELQNGQKMYYIGDKVYYSPDMENEKRVRFSAYTWSYFFLFPYKLSDEGTVWTDYKPKSMNEKNYLVHKLNFEAGTGDAPDDWYVVYANKEKPLIEVAAYIVTAGKSQEKAEENPHAIKYENYQEVAGVPIARDWTFWGWTAEEGLTKQLGEATLTNVKFIEVGETFFEAPKDFKEI